MEDNSRQSYGLFLTPFPHSLIFPLFSTPILIGTYANVQSDAHKLRMYCMLEPDLSFHS